MTDSGAGDSTPRVTTQTPAATPATTASVTLSDSHEMFIAIGVMAGFVVVAVVIAGINQETGRAMLALMFLLLLLQGLSHTNPFVQWAQKHPLTPAGGTK